MEAGMKLCKECGLEFKPKGRESYCTREHYRPCPVCQKPVLIKYLSDPTPCCSKECTKAKRSSKMAPKSAAATMNFMSTSDSSATGEYSLANFKQGSQRRFAGRNTSLGFIPGHVYTIEINKEYEYGNYIVNATYDHTEDRSCDLTTVCSSMLNLMKNTFVEV